MRTFPLFVALVSGLVVGCTTLAPTEPNLVASIEKAPITPDGNVAGRATDLVIHFDVTPDPAVPGRALKAGRSLRVTLPDGFENTGGRPLLEYASDPRCGPQKLDCNTAALLQGWPQNPVAFRKVALSFDGPRTLVLTAREDIGPASEHAPGIKGVHLLLSGFRNPAPGLYPVRVEAETGPGGALERGVGEVEIVAAPRRSINITSVFDQPLSLPKTTPPTRASTLHQVAAPGSAVPIPWNFLVWDTAGEAMVGATLVPDDARSDRYILRRNGIDVGVATIDAPRAARGQRLIVEQPAAAIKAPISFVPTARLRVQFITGDLPGDYVVTFALDGGNAVQMRVRVPAPT